MIICRQGKVFWIKVSKVQERRDADVGEIENSGEEQECRKKTKKEREVKNMKNHVHADSIYRQCICSFGDRKVPL